VLSFLRRRRFDATSSSGPLRLPSLDSLLKILGAARALAAIAALGILALAAWDLHLRLVQLEPDLLYTHQLLPILGGTATNLEKTLREERNASKDQLAQSSAVLKNVNSAVAQATDDLAEFKKLIAGLERTNETLDAAIATQSAEMVETQKQAQAALASLNAALVESSAVMADADRVIADPALPEILKHLDAAIVQAESALEHVDSMAASGDRDMQMIEVRLRQALKPAGLAKTIFMRALGLAGPAAQVATAVK
jgi:chromosome segregation ATPase